MAIKLITVDKFIYCQIYKLHKIALLYYKELYMSINKVEFYLDWFYKEKERTYHLDNASNIPFAILSAYFIIVVTLVRELLKSDYDDWVICYLIPYMLGFTYYLVLSMYNLLKSLVLDNREYLDFPNHRFLEIEEENIQQYIEDLEKEGFPIPDKQKLLESNLIQILIKCIDQNLKNNDIRSSHLFKAKRNIWNMSIITMLGLATFGFYLLNN